MATTAPRGRTRGSDIFFLLTGFCFGITVFLQMLATTGEDLNSLNGIITVISRYAALASGYLILVGLLLVARIPWVEKSLGHDRLVELHKKIGPYSLYLLLTHVVLVTIGYSTVDNSNFFQEFWRLTTLYPWMLPAVAGFVLLIMAGVTSYKRARSRMKYETWWVIHLYTYLGISLSFMHQIRTGEMFIHHPVIQSWWAGLYIFVYSSIAIWRIGIPLAVSLRHKLVVEKVVEEAPGIISVHFKGRKLQRLSAEGGNFFGWRFLTRDHWWQSHPYSLSAPPTHERMRITVKDLGDQSAALKDLQPGTKVMAEGPYGVFTASTRKKKRVVLIGGGIGITPIRALLEEIPSEVNCDVIYRAPRPEEVVFKDEFDRLAVEKGARIHYLVGSRTVHPINATTLKARIPLIQEADIYVCGPKALVLAVHEAAKKLGIKDDHVHDEAFAF